MRNATQLLDPSAIERERLKQEIIELQLRLDRTSRGPSLLSRPLTDRQGIVHDSIEKLLGRSIRG